MMLSGIREEHQMNNLRSLMFAIVAIVISVAIAHGKSFFKPGDPAPNFTLETLDGQTVSLAQFKGKVVVLGLFHICEPCLIQGTELQKVHEALKGKNVQVLGVNSAGNSKDKVKEFLKEFPLTVTYPYMIDPKKETDKLYGGGRFIPNVYVIDQEGRVRWQRVGTMEIGGAEVIKAEVEKLLGGDGKAGGAL
jgi:cytochrome c biogenesis protein CcmG/thiol:disulfide interchange protein DsbE